MIKRELTADDGPKLREESNYHDFYPNLNKDDHLPLFIRECDTLIDDINVNKDYAHVEGNQGIPIKQLISNGKVNVEPLVIESKEADCHKCNIHIKDLTNDINGIRQDDAHKVTTPQFNVFEQNPYLTKLDSIPDLVTRVKQQYDKTIKSNITQSFEEMKRKLCKITPNLAYLTDYYDMDEQDELFLRHLQTKYPNLKLNHLQFELLFTLLELEYTWFQSHIPKPSPPPASPDQLCSVCNGIETPNNTIVFCDCCNIAVHQDCYGIIFIPAGPWLCRVCLQNNMPSQRPRCLVCPELNGPMKQTTSGNWIHVACAVWIKELNFGNWHYLEPIEGVERIPNLRWKLSCFICKQKMGACIQCFSKNCFTAYHVSCARRASLQMTHLKTSSLAEMALGNDNELISYCDKHSYISNENEQVQNFDKIVEEVRLQVEKDNEFYNNRLQTELVIPPHIFADYIIEASQVLKLLTDLSMIREFSFTLCKYWSLKREFNKGAPLLTINDSIIQYSYNLLEDNDIKDKVAFIDVLLQDLEKVGRLTSMVNQRNEKEKEIAEIENKIGNLLRNPSIFILKERIGKDFTNKDAFKVISKYMKDNDLNYKYIDDCLMFNFNDILSFRTATSEFFTYLKDLNIVSRLISSALEKLEIHFDSMMENMKSIDIPGLLRQDFVINYDDLTSTVERNWAGHELLKEEELSDVEELTNKEANDILDIIDPLMKKERFKIENVAKKGMKKDNLVVSGPLVEESGSDITEHQYSTILIKDGSRTRRKPGPKPKPGSLRKKYILKTYPGKRRGRKPGKKLNS